MIGISAEERLQKIGRLMAEDEFSGPLRHILRLATKRTLVSFLSRISATYWQNLYAGLEATRPSASVVRVEVRRGPLIPVLYAVNTGMPFNARTMELCGAAKVEAEIVDITTVGEEAGMPMVDLAYALRF